MGLGLAILASCAVAWLWGFSDGVRVGSGKGTIVIREDKD